MTTLIELIKNLPYKAALWVGAHKTEVLNLIKKGASLPYLIRYVISKVY